MIDLHCHILPGLDDGARDIDDSIAMARQGEQDGVEIVCATPHIRSDHAVGIDQIAQRVRLLQGELDVDGVRVSIVPGGELAQSEADRLTDEELHTVALGGAGGWVLLEPAAGALGDDLERTVGRLAEREVASVVAHPERHAGSDFERRLRRLTELGCLIQWTAQFVAEAAPGDLVLELARDGLVHLLGSDSHSAAIGRPVQLGAGFARLESVCSPQRVRWMREHAPRAILRAEPVAAMP
ncbi:MAG TPA: CpsB/CapC family capsule biosynthesis tyrosine phosphatase [Solirubrobacteraceae bacterium]|nr:CpsB/CapC family capsule biosynthesis tyrosine phosphatase [Solirubrobacteraceae bacterium]